MWGCLGQEWERSTFSASKPERHFRGDINDHLARRASQGTQMVKNPPANAGDGGASIPWVRKIPWRGKWQPTPVFLPRKSHGQRSLAGYSPQVCKIIRHDLTTKGRQHVCQTLTGASFHCSMVEKLSESSYFLPISLGSG